MQRKLGGRQRSLMLEAARRWMMETRSVGHYDVQARMAFVTGDNRKSMANAWTGLGTHSEYNTTVNAGLMTHAHWCHGPICWWRMTDKGASLVQSWIHAGLHAGHFDGYEPSYHVDPIIESCRQNEMEESCTK